jgi:hypothetical protein
MLKGRLGDMGIADEAAQIVEQRRFLTELQLKVEMFPLVYGNCRIPQSARVRELQEHHGLQLSVIELDHVLELRIGRIRTALTGM